MRLEDRLALESVEKLGEYIRRAEALESSLRELIPLAVEYQLLADENLLSLDDNWAVISRAKALLGGQALSRVGDTNDG